MKKYYTLNIDKFDGARKNYEKADIEKYYKKILKSPVDDFRINSRGAEYMNFTIDSQLLRRLKLKKLSGDIKSWSSEDYILQLVSKSEEVESLNKFTTSYSYTYNNYFVNEYLFDDIEKNNPKNMKQHNKFQSKQINQHIKKYNKNVR